MKLYLVGLYKGKYLAGPVNIKFCKEFLNYDFDNMAPGSYVKWAITNDVGSGLIFRTNGGLKAHYFAEEIE